MPSAPIGTRAGPGPSRRNSLHPPPARRAAARAAAPRPIGFVFSHIQSAHYAVSPIQESTCHAFGRLPIGFVSHTAGLQPPPRRAAPGPIGFVSHTAGLEAAARPGPPTCRRVDVGRGGRLCDLPRTMRHLRLPARNRGPALFVHYIPYRRPASASREKPRLLRHPIPGQANDLAGTPRPQRKGRRKGVPARRSRCPCREARGPCSQRARRTACTICAGMPGLTSNRAKKTPPLHPWQPLAPPQNSRAPPPNTITGGTMSAVSKPPNSRPPPPTSGQRAAGR